MNDVETKDVVAYILDRMGLKHLREDAENGNNIDMYIGYIKHKSKYYSQLQDCINYFL